MRYWHQEEKQLQAHQCEFRQSTATAISKIWQYIYISSYFNNFIKAFISNHPDIRFCILTAEQEEFHSNSQQLLKLWRISKQTLKNYSVHWGKQTLLARLEGFHNPTTHMLYTAKKEETFSGF